MTPGEVVTSEDVAWLSRTVALAGPAQVVASPNPGVGCVLVRGGEVVGEGTSRPAGGDHAEVVALTAAGVAASGATAYVSLEPCAHHGRTPACTDALLAAGVARVVIAHPDVNPIAAGGAQRLASAGVVVTGPLPPEHVVRASVAAQLEGFLRLTTAGRPHVTLKLAQTADGHLQVGAGRRWITGRAARTAVHRWRANRDAVLVGVGTVLADDPQLSVREVASDHQPRPVVLDAHARTPPTAAVARPGAVVVTSPSAPAAARRRLADRGVEVVEVPAGGSRGVDLPAALRALAGLGVCSVLAEPGRTLAAALVEAGLVDRLVLHIAVGQGRGPLRHALSVTEAAWRTERLGGAGEDLIHHLLATEGSTGAGERSETDTAAPASEPPPGSPPP